MAYTDFKNQMLARTTGLDIDNSGDFDCVDIPKAYAVFLFPNLGWITTIGYGNAKDLWGRINETYFTRIPNDVNNPNQLPQPGDIMVFDRTPIAGYTNQYDNPYGHIGVCDSANSSGYTLLQQASGTGRKPWLQYQPWNYRKCLGWYRPKAVSAPTPTPVPTTQGETPMTTQESQGVATALYRKLLKREPDAGGLANYAPKIKAGEFDFVVGDIASSQEFKNVNTVTKTVVQTVEVTKEVPVEKIVTKTVTVEAPLSWSIVSNWVLAQVKAVFNKVDFKKVVAVVKPLLDKFGKK